MEIEKVFCPQHCMFLGRLCMLKTGTRPESKNYHKNIYMCPLAMKGECDFSTPPKARKMVPIQLCKKHNLVIAARMWHEEVPNRIAIMCTSKPKGGACGYYDLKTQGDKENPSKSVARDSSAKDKADTEDSLRDIHQKSKPKQALGELQNPGKTHKKDARFVPEPPVFQSRDFADLSALEAEAEREEVCGGRSARLRHSDPMVAGCRGLAGNHEGEGVSEGERSGASGGGSVTLEDTCAEQSEEESDGEGEGAEASEEESDGEGEGVEASEEESDGEGEGAEASEEESDGEGKGAEASEQESDGEGGGSESWKTCEGERASEEESDGEDRMNNDESAGEVRSEESEKESDVTMDNAEEEDQLGEMFAGDRYGVTKREESGEDDRGDSDEEIGENEEPRRELGGSAHSVSEASDEESEGGNSEDEGFGEQSGGGACDVSKGEEFDVGSEDGEDSKVSKGEQSADGEVSDDGDSGEEPDAYNASKDETFHASEEEDMSGASDKESSGETCEETQREGYDASDGGGESEVGDGGGEPEVGDGGGEPEVGDGEPQSNREEAEVEGEEEKSSGKDELESSYRPLPELHASRKPVAPAPPLVQHPMMSTARPVAPAPIFPPMLSATKPVGPVFPEHRATITRPAVPIIDPPAHDPEQPKKKLFTSLQPKEDTEKKKPFASLQPKEDRATIPRPAVPVIDPPAHDPEQPKKKPFASLQPKEDTETAFKVGYQSRKVIQQIQQIELMIRTMSQNLPDGGAELKRRRAMLYERLAQMKKPPQVPPAGFGHAATVSKKGIIDQARGLTSGMVEHLHKTLEDCPTADTLAEDPSHLTVSLMNHQKHALAWMNWREKQTPSAGILADDMGLGKTLSMLSLVTAGRVKAKDWVRDTPAKEGLVKCAGTLVVCPTSLMMQWQGEARSKFKPGTIKSLVYHGSSRTRDPTDFTRYDLVVTTYNIVGIEGASCPDDEELYEAKPKDDGKKKRKGNISTLFEAHWHRVILDEAHVIRNHKTALSKGACKLKADMRWAVTGTPIQNNLRDFYSLIKFMHLAPFDDYRIWKATVEQKGSVGMRRLNMMVSTMVLRRTKEEMNERKQLQLTDRKVETHVIQLCPEEENVYQVLFSEARKVMFKWLEEQGEIHHARGGSDESTDYSALSDNVARLVSMVMRPYLQGSSRGRCVLGLLLRLRQCCCHLNLLTTVLDKSETDRAELALEVAMGALALDSEDVDSHLPAMKDNIPRVFTKEEASTKISTVLRELQRIEALGCEPVEKSIIVSQWTSMLDIMEMHLKEVGISSSRIDGKVLPRERQVRMEQFNLPRRNPTVMLLSLQAGGVGLNLIGANHVFMLDMHWNPALEVQAADRCHRVGQLRDVVIHKFVTESTVEERILRLQEKKLLLAKNVLEGASEKTRKNHNTLSLNDLKDLFAI